MRLLLFAATFCLYAVTYANHPTGDGYFYLHNIETADYVGLMNPTTLLTQLGYFWLWKLVGGSALHVIQAGNALASGLNAVLMYSIAQRLGLDRVSSVCAAGLLVLSYGHWYYANGDFQHLSLVVVLLIVYLAVVIRTHQLWMIVLLAMLNALAVLLRIENFLIGFAVAAYLAMTAHPRAREVVTVMYPVYGAIWLAVLLLPFDALALQQRISQTYLADYFSWFLRTRQHPQEYQGFAHAMWFDPFRALKGQMTALTIGVQTITDFVRGIVRADDAVVFGLILVTITALVVLFWGGRWTWDAFTALCLVWLGVYFCLHAIFWPSVTKYHIVSLPPLIFLAVRSASHPSRLVVATVLLAAVNLYGAIIPWYQYGLEKARVAAALRDVGPALFVSSESGMDHALPGGAGHYSVKDECRRQDSAEPCMVLLVDQMRDALRNGRRVIMYNYAPTPFTLIGINQSRTHGRAMTQRDFSGADEAYRSLFHFSPLLTYWEEAKHPLYLYGRDVDTMWEVTR